MKLIDILKQGAKKTQLKKQSLFTFSITKQKEYIQAMGIPKDDVERSYFQYKCQMKLMGLPMSIGLNVFSFFVLCYVWLTKGIKKESVEILEKVDAVFVSQGISENVIPESLKKQCQSIKVISEVGDRRFTAQDREFVVSIWKRYPFAVHFVLKIFLKVNMYSAWRVLYNPDAILVCSEYSFTSSIMTAYCTHFGIQHYNVMHGEKLYYMRDAFFRFDRCYVWDEFYKELFIELKADEEQFIIELPRSMRFTLGGVKKTVDYTFYLTNEQEEELKKIAYYFRIMRKKGCKILLRPHPRYTDLKMIKKNFEENEIEDNKEISVECSILRTKNVISLYSTVLNQALSNDVNIVIDDVTNSAKYIRLAEMKFICLSKPHKLLSQVLCEEVENEKDN